MPSQTNSWGGADLMKLASYVAPRRSQQLYSQPSHHAAILTNRKCYRSRIKNSAHRVRRGLPRQKLLTYALINRLLGRNAGMLEERPQVSEAPAACCNAQAPVQQPAMHITEEVSSMNPWLGSRMSTISLYTSR